MNDDILILSNVCKNFGEAKILNNLCLNVKNNEFLTLLGPSGCGKTTTLRIISGLETPSSGSVVLEGIDVKDKEPNERNVNTVFQNYALFPHMSVEKNIAYPLLLKRVDKKEIQQRVNEMLSLVKLEGFNKRKISSLSGGQKQRIALVRALINKPKILLLDEPLGALDLQLRRMMQFELKRIQKHLGLTFIYITHDQEEALNMSDRIAVMNKGTIEQIGTPDEIYNRPKTSYVASFVGNANIIKAKVEEVANDMAKIKFCDNFFYFQNHNFTPGDILTFAIRSEHILVDKTKGTFSAEVIEKSYVGSMLRIVLKTNCQQELIVTNFGFDSVVKEGDRVCFTWKDNSIILVDHL